MEKLSKSKIDSLKKEIEELVEKRLGENAGEVQVVVVDRTRYEYMSFIPLPLERDVHTREERMHIFNFAVANLQVATSDIDRISRFLSFDRKYELREFRETVRERIELLEAEREEAQRSESEALRKNGPLRSALRSALDMAITFAGDGVHAACLAGQKSCKASKCVKFRGEWKKLRDVYGKGMPARALESILGQVNVKVPD